MLKATALFVVLAAAAGASGCRAPAPSASPGGESAAGAGGRERIELEAFAAALRRTVETRAIDIGEPSAQPHLREGWGTPEKSGETSFVWGAGPLSRLAFGLVEPRDLELRLRGWSFPFAAGESQRVELLLNGRAAGEQAIGPEATTLRFTVPATLLRAGENLLELRYGRSNPRRGHAPWAVAWDGVRFEPAGKSRERVVGALPDVPQVDIAGGTLTLPAGSAVDATLELAPGTRLAWDAVAASGSARLALAVEGEAREAAERRVPATAAGDFDLAGGASQTALVRFALRAPGADGEVRVSGLRLERPLRRSGGSPPPVPTAAPAAAARAVGTAEAVGVVAGSPNLILYIIDTLRADHLGCYGYPRPTSPRIDRFAAESILFAHGRAQSSWTKPAVATILTGLYPPAHGAERRSQRVHENVDSLAERLQAAGYETALFTTNANITVRFGFDQGWDTFRYLAHRRGKKHEHFDAEEVNREVFAWLAERARRSPEKPFLLVVHTLDPHDPYRPREEFRRLLAPEVDVESACCAGAYVLGRLRGTAAESRAADLRALYDAEIAQNDAAFGDLLDELDRHNLAASSAVLLTSDHGEEFLDHGGWKHGFTLYEEMLRIPFVLRLPESGRAGTAGRTIVSPVDQIDIAPTFLALAGAPPAPGLPGRDVRRLLVEGRPSPDGAGVAEVSLAWLQRPGAQSTSTVAGGWKWIDFGGDRTTPAWADEPATAPPSSWKLPDRELYRLTTDPGERTNLLDPGRPRPLRELWLEGQLAGALARYGGSAAAEEAEIDPELERSLRALGYF